MPYDPERHHRRSVRMREHDYSAGVFFVTICAHDRACIFGRIDAGRMVLNALGEVVQDEWNRSSTMRQELDHIAVVVMPNHLHGLVLLSPHGLDAERVQVAPTKPRMQRTARSLGAFIGGFKAASTRRIRDITRTSNLSVWQRGYYEHLVRTDTAMTTIVNYILTNPLRWHLDPENPEGTELDDSEWWLNETGVYDS